MTKSYNIILDSSYGTVSGPSSQSYFVDFNMLGSNKKKLEVSFTFTSYGTDIANQDLAVISLDIEQNNTFTSQNNNTKYQKF